MNLSILADLRGVVPQVEHTGTPKFGQGVPMPKGYECNNNNYLSFTEHLEHPEHQKIVVTDKSSENETLWGPDQSTTQAENVNPGANMEVQQLPQARGSKEVRQQRLSKVKAECNPTGELDLGLGPAVAFPSGTTANYGPL